MTTKQALQRILKGILHTGEEERQSQTPPQERINFLRGIKKQMRIRKDSTIIKLLNQQAPKLNKGKKRGTNTTVINQEKNSKIAGISKYFSIM
jgi:hypothetical protein